MLAWRLAISAILIPLLIGLFVIDHRLGEPAWVLLILVQLLAARAVWELVHLINSRGTANPLTALPLVIGSGAIILANWIPHLCSRCQGSDLAWSLSAFVAVVFAFCGRACLNYREPGGNLERLGLEILIVTYIGLLLTLTTQLRWVAGAHVGYLALGSLLLCTKGGDIGAFFFGRRWGRRKMAPLLSPGKTWEGIGGALLGASLGGVLWFQFAPAWLLDEGAPGWWLAALGYGAILGTAGAAGDLFESLIKRDVGSKDSAALMPGFGGLLDLLDSILFAGPVALLLWHVWPVIQHSSAALAELQ